MLSSWTIDPAPGPRLLLLTGVWNRGSPPWSVLPRSCTGLTQGQGSACPAWTSMLSMVSSSQRRDNGVQLTFLQSCCRMSCFSHEALKNKINWKKKKKLHFQWKTDPTQTGLFSSVLDALSAAIWSVGITLAVFPGRPLG